jgi:hypothetical protein
MSEEFSVLSVTNHYEDGKLTGYSVGDGEVVSLAEEEPLLEPELFPVKKPKQPKQAAQEEPLLPPTMEDLFKRDK